MLWHRRAVDGAFLRRDEHILELDVSVRRAVRVHVLQRLRELVQHGLSPRHVRRLGLEPLTQVAPLVVRELEVGDGRLVRRVEDRLKGGDVRVAQLAQEPHLIAQLGPLLRVAELILLQDARRAVKDRSARAANYR